MTVTEAVQYLRIAEAHGGVDAIPLGAADMLENLELIMWDIDEEAYDLTANGRQWLEQLTKDL